jgi:hypothetical protein
VDWHDVVAGNPESVTIRHIPVPYVAFENQDDVTTSLGPVFEARLETALRTLWQSWSRLHGR